MFYLLKGEKICSFSLFLSVPFNDITKNKIEIHSMHRKPKTEIVRKLYLCTLSLKRTRMASQIGD
jgi:hypothetical protein